MNSFEIIFAVGLPPVLTYVIGYYHGKIKTHLGFERAKLTREITAKNNPTPIKYGGESLKYDKYHSENVAPVLIPASITIKKIIPKINKPSPNQRPTSCIAIIQSIPQFCLNMIQKCRDLTRRKIK